MAEEKEVKTYTKKDDFMKNITATSTKVEKKRCEALGAFVYLRQMGALDYESYQQSLLSFDYDEKTERTDVRYTPVGMRLKYLVRALCDEQGNRLFKDDEFMELADKDPDVISELYELAVEVNKATVSKQEIKGMEKNSDAGLKDDSPSS